MYQSLARTRHFLCCIPVRVGVFVLSLSMFLGWTSLAGFVFFSLGYISTHEQQSNIHFHLGFKIGWGVSGGLWLIFGLISLFGFIGSITRKRNYVATYSQLMWFMWFTNLTISGAIVIGLVLLKVDAPKLIQECRSGATQGFNGDSGIITSADSTTTTTQLVDDCQNLVDAVSKTAVIVTFSISLTIQLLWNLYGAVVVRRYVRQLEDEDENSMNSNNNGQPKLMVYTS